MIPFGTPIYPSPYFEPDYLTIELPMASKHRSRRIWKKLMKRVRERARPVWTQVYVIDGKMFCHPTVYEQLQQQMAGDIS